MRAFEGVVFGQGAGKLATIVDTTGPTFDDPAELALDAAALSVTGLPASPTADLRFKLVENDGFVQACTAAGCVGNAVLAPFGTTSVWSKAPWSFEYLAAIALNTRYGARYGHQAIWTGSEMIVWGGLALQGQGTDGVLATPTGCIYKP